MRVSREVGFCAASFPDVVDRASFTGRAGGIGARLVSSRLACPLSDVSLLLVALTRVRASSYALSLYSSIYAILSFTELNMRRFISLMDE